MRIEVRPTDLWFGAEEAVSEDCSRCHRPIPEHCVALRLWNNRGDTLQYHPCCLGMTPCCGDEDEETPP